MDFAQSAGLDLFAQWHFRDGRPVMDILRRCSRQHLRNGSLGLFDKNNCRQSTASTALRSSPHQEGAVCHFGITSRAAHSAAPFFVRDTATASLMNGESL
jgi:hypothetical protein